MLEFLPHFPLLFVFIFHEIPKDNHQSYPVCLCISISKWWISCKGSKLLISSMSQTHRPAITSACHANWDCDVWYMPSRILNGHYQFTSSLLFISRCMRPRRSVWPSEGSVFCSDLIIPVPLYKHPVTEGPGAFGPLMRLIQMFPAHQDKHR